MLIAVLDGEVFDFQMVVVIGYTTGVNVPFCVLDVDFRGGNRDVCSLVTVVRGVEVCHRRNLTIHVRVIMTIEGQRGCQLVIVDAAFQL